jgi:hypothetical protein
MKYGEGEFMGLWVYGVYGFMYPGMIFREGL